MEGFVDMTPRMTHLPAAVASIAATSLLLLAPTASPLSILPDAAVRTIDRGGIAVVPDFLAPSEVSRLRSDASGLHADGHFIVDALASYGSRERQGIPQLICI